MINAFKLLWMSELIYSFIISIVFFVDYFKINAGVSYVQELFIFYFGVAAFVIMNFCLIFFLLRVFLNKITCDFKRLSSIFAGVLLTATTWLQFSAILSSALNPQG